MQVVRVAVAMAVVGMVSLAGGAAAPAAAGPVWDQLRAELDRILLAPDAREPASLRREPTRAVALFDVPEMSRRALGRHWDARTPAERAEFVRLFGGLLERAFVTRLDKYRGERIAFVAEATEGDRATVRTAIQPADGHRDPRGDIAVDYRLVRRGERWKIYDVLVENVSLVGNYRSQFEKLITAGSFEDVLERLRVRGARRTAIH